MTKIGHFLCGFSLVDFSAVGVLGLLMTFKTQRQKVMFLYKSDFHWLSNAFLQFDFQTCGFTQQGGNASQQCSAALRLKAKKNLPREVYLLAHGLMLNWSWRHAFIHATKHEIYGFFTVFRKFSWKIYKSILQEMKNGLSSREQQLQVIFEYIIT